MLLRIFSVGNTLAEFLGFLCPHHFFHLTPVVHGSLNQIISLLALSSTWKSLFLDVPQQPLLPAIKWLKLTYFFFFFDAHQIWTSLYLLQNSSHDLQSPQHTATKDSIRLTHSGTRLTLHTKKPQKRPRLWPLWS